MQTIFFLRTDKINKDGIAPIFLRISHRSQQTKLRLGITLSPSDWNGEKQVVLKSNPDATHINGILNYVRNKISTLELTLLREGKLNSMTAIEFRDSLDQELHPEQQKVKKTDDTLIEPRFAKYAELRAPKTQDSIMQTRRRLEVYLGADGLANLHFDDVNLDWLNRWNAFMAKTSPSQNARNVHLRNLRCIFNDAINNELTTNYPFRRFKWKKVETEKRSLSVEELRRVIFFPANKTFEKYRDMFTLSFMLHGVNMEDLLLMKADQLQNHRLSFHRHKTKYLYNKLVEPEAQYLIDKHSGVDYLVNVMEHWTTYKTAQTKVNRMLQLLGPYTVQGRGGKHVYEPMFPELTSYWARHSWATIAAELDVPNEVIAAGLGHSYGNTVTNIYIRQDVKKVDAANRKILDWVLYGIKEGHQVVAPGTPEFFGLTKPEAQHLGLC
jgi:integrase